MRQYTNILFLSFIGEPIFLIVWLSYLLCISTQDKDWQSGLCYTLLIIVYYLFYLIAIAYSYLI